MFYYVDDSDGSLWAYDLEEYARPGLRGPLTPEEVYAIQNPPLTPEQIFANNRNTLDNLLYVATEKMLPHFLLSIDLGSGTDSETQSARAWQNYLKQLVAVDIVPESPQWPELPEN